MTTNTITGTSSSWMDGVAASASVSGVCVDWYENIPHRELEELRKQAAKSKVPEIKDVIYNPPATIVHWMDGEKTVIKVQEGDTYNPEKGLLLAFAKRLFGNDNTFNKVMHKWCDVEEINRTLELRELKKIRKLKKQAKAKTVEKNFIADIENASEIHVGDRVVMYQHIEEDNRQFEPDIGTIGTVTSVTSVYGHGNGVVVKWPEGTVQGGGTVWCLPEKSVRRVNK